MTEDDGRETAEDGARELRVHGVHAVLALWVHRPQDVRRVYVTEARLPRFGAILQECARRRVPYRVVGDDDLERLTESVHHEGVAVVARERPQPTLPEVLARLADAPHATLCWLDGVSNPHNVGSLLRTAAHFGVPALVGSERMPRLSPSACRVAEGAAETVDLVRVPRTGEAFAALREAGFRIVGTDGRDGRGLFRAALPQRVVVVLGGEVSGMSPDVRALLDEVVRIPGTGAVDSLNVAAAAAVVLAELWRRVSAGSAGGRSSRGGGRGRSGRRRSPPSP